MNRLCERPGCSSPADVAYGFDADSQIMWLDAVVAVVGTRHGVLCRRHADSMIVPLGWMLDDRREPTPRLFKAPAVALRASPPRRERRPRDETGEQLRLDGAVVDAVVAAPDAQRDSVRDAGTGADPAWVPVFDPADDLHGLLKARGRLLS